jgi:biotin carboxylase
LCSSSWDKQGLTSENYPGYQFVFYGDELVETPSLLQVLRFDVKLYISETAKKFRRETIHGVIGTGDYPGCMLAAGVASEMKLPGPKLRDIVLLSHKLYSRDIQRKYVPEATPKYAPINPFRRLNGNLGLQYPFFVKPVKGTMSIRARMVHNQEELKQALDFSFGERVEKFLLLRPFQQLLRAHSDGRAPAHYFIGESPLSGVQVTVDGFIQNGRATIMGVVDSVMYPGTISFERFDHPSRLPAPILERMQVVAKTVIEGSGLDHTCFNIEMFFEAARDNISIIEINPRMSYQFADLYQRVDGTSTYEIQLALATGAAVDFQRGRGRDGAATSFVLRRFQDAVPLSIPSEVDKANVLAKYPGTDIRIYAKVGEKLSAQDQDVGSYRYGIINMGARTYDELLENYAEVRRMLPFNYRDL